MLPVSPIYSFASGLLKNKNDIKIGKRVMDITFKKDKEYFSLAINKIKKKEIQNIVKKPSAPSIKFIILMVYTHAITTKKTAIFNGIFNA